MYAFSEAIFSIILGLVMHELQATHSNPSSMKSPLPKWKYIQPGNAVNEASLTQDKNMNKLQTSVLPCSPYWINFIFAWLSTAHKASSTNSRTLVETTILRTSQVKVRTTVTSPRLLQWKKRRRFFLKNYHKKIQSNLHTEA